MQGAIVEKNSMKNAMFTSPKKEILDLDKIHVFPIKRNCRNKKEHKKTVSWNKAFHFMCVPIPSNSHLKIILFCSGFVVLWEKMDANH